MEQLEIIVFYAKKLRFENGQKNIKFYNQAISEFERLGLKLKPVDEAELNTTLHFLKNSWYCRAKYFISKLDCNWELRLKLKEELNKKYFDYAVLNMTW